MLYARSSVSQSQSNSYRFASYPRFAIRLYLPHIMNPSAVLAQSLAPRRSSVPVMDVGMVEPDWRHLVRRYHVSSTGPPVYPAGDLNHLTPEHSTVFGERVAPADGLHVTRPILYGNEHRAFPPARVLSGNRQGSPHNPFIIAQLNHLHRGRHVGTGPDLTISIIWPLGYDVGPAGPLDNGHSAEKGVVRWRPDMTL